ncbi:MAG: universal stress protein [Rhodobacteraceae bacterium]|nr:universal stress protein [Paracoccaceae bacterium]
MYKNILVPIALDDERDTASAMDIARILKSEGGTITALHVIEALPSYVAQYLSAEQLNNRQGETETLLKSELGGVTDIKPVVITGHSGNSIVDYATDHDFDCIVVASHRPGLQDYFLGSTAARVVRHAPCAVHVLR